MNEEPAPSGENAPFVWLLFSGIQKKAGAALHKGDANAPTRKQVL
jgi:hypothetical protein